MGWFWGGNSNKNDPTKSLPSDLKDFLADQQPRPYVPTEPPPSKPAEQADKPTQQLPDTNKTFEERLLPKESLFQDGRYKDIWKTYTPQDSITTNTSSPLERLISARKDRKELVHRAAMENCAFEQELQQNCLKSGDLFNRTRARMTACKQETKAFNRCYQLQAKFLQALGYLTSSTNSEEEEERIQMHADKLYHRMMDYEAAVAEAKANNTPVPPLSSLFDPSRPAPNPEQLNVPKSVEIKMKTPLQELPAHERELAARAALQEAKMAHLYTNEYARYAVEMDDARTQRQQWLVKTFGEPIGKFIVPDLPNRKNGKSAGTGERDEDVSTQQRNLPKS